MDFIRILERAKAIQPFTSRLASPMVWGSSSSSSQSRPGLCSAPPKPQASLHLVPAGIGCHRPFGSTGSPPQPRCHSPAHSLPSQRGGRGLPALPQQPFSSGVASPAAGVSSCSPSPSQSWLGVCALLPKPPHHPTPFLVPHHQVGGGQGRAPDNAEVQTTGFRTVLYCHSTPSVDAASTSKPALLPAWFIPAAPHREEGRSARTMRPHEGLLLAQRHRAEDTPHQHSCAGRALYPPSPHHSSLHQHRQRTSPATFSIRRYIRMGQTTDFPPSGLSTAARGLSTYLTPKAGSSLRQSFMARVTSPAESMLGHRSVQRGRRGSQTAICSHCTWGSGYLGKLLV